MPTIESMLRRQARSSGAASEATLMLRIAIGYALVSMGIPCQVARASSEMANLQFIMVSGSYMAKDAMNSGTAIQPKGAA